jgi:hypothetical protein
MTIVGLPLDWACSAAFTAQSAHFFFACTVVFALKLYRKPIWPLWIIAPIVAAVKEFGIDMAWEETATWANQTLDFCVYMLGMILASIVASRR